MRIRTLSSTRTSTTKLLVGLVLLAFMPITTTANEVPDFVGQGESATLRSDLPVGSLEFVVALDDPPFSFLDGNSKLNGFSVYLARAVCEELGATNCIISGRLTAQLNLASPPDSAAVVISGAQATQANRLDYFFSKPYLKVPARFVGRKSGNRQLSFATGLPGARIGVKANSPHERMAREFFPDALTVGYAESSPLFDELESGKIDLVFGDGLELANWISTSGDNGCCKFAGGPYYSNHFLGEGVRFAVPIAKGAIVAQIDAALAALQRKGKIEELFLRFFPLSFY